MICEEVVLQGIDLKNIEDFFFNDTATTEIYTLSLHDALPISNKKLEPKLENIAWIAGNWNEPSGGSMMATFKLINNG